MHRGPNSSALRMPFQFLTGCGSRQRRSPNGGWPNGMALKLRMPSFCAALDWRTPLAVLTRSAANDDWVAAVQMIMAVRMDVEAFIGLGLTRMVTSAGRRWFHRASPRRI